MYSMCKKKNSVKFISIKGNKILKQNMQMELNPWRQFLQFSRYWPCPFQSKVVLKQK